MTENIIEHNQVKKQVALKPSLSCTEFDGPEHFSSHQLQKLEVLSDSLSSKSSSISRKRSSLLTKSSLNFEDPPALHDLFHHELQKVPSGRFSVNSFTVHQKKNLHTFSTHSRHRNRYHYRRSFTKLNADDCRGLASNEALFNELKTVQLDQINPILPKSSELTHDLCSNCANGMHCKEQQCSELLKYTHVECNESNSSNYENPRVKHRNANKSDSSQGRGDRSKLQTKESARQRAKQEEKSEEVLSVVDDEETHFSEVVLPADISSYRSPEERPGLFKQWTMSAYINTCTPTNVSKISMSKSQGKEEEAELHAASDQSESKLSFPFTLLGTATNLDRVEDQSVLYHDGVNNPCVQKELLDTVNVLQEASPIFHQEEKRENIIGEIDRSSVIRETKDIRTVFWGNNLENMTWKGPAQDREVSAIAMQRDTLIPGKDVLKEEQRYRVSKKHLNIANTSPTMVPKISKPKGAEGERNKYDACELQNATDSTSISTTERDQGTFKARLAFEKMTTEEVSQWLKLIGLEKCIPVVKEHCITGQQLINIDRVVLALMDLQDAHERKKLISAVYQELLPDKLTVEQILDVCNLDASILNVNRPETPSLNSTDKLESPVSESCIIRHSYRTSNEDKYFLENTLRTARTDEDRFSRVLGEEQKPSDIELCDEGIHDRKAKLKKKRKSLSSVIPASGYLLRIELEMRPTRWSFTIGTDEDGCFIVSSSEFTELCAGDKLIEVNGVNVIDYPKTELHHLLNERKTAELIVFRTVDKQIVRMYEKEKLLEKTVQELETLKMDISVVKNKKEVLWSEIELGQKAPE